MAGLGTEEIVTTPPGAARAEPDSDPMQKRRCPSRVPVRAGADEAKEPAAGSANPKGNKKGSKPQAQKGKGKGKCKSEGGGEVLPSPAGVPDAEQEGTGKGGKGRGGRGGKGRGGRGRGGNDGNGAAAGQDPAARRQVFAEQNLQIIRNLAAKHPDLQPQVGFTGKQLGRTILQWCKYTYRMINSILHRSHVILSLS